MVKMELEGIVKEIVFRSEYSCKFLLSKNDRLILCTITKSNIKLADYIKEDEPIKINAQMNAYIRFKDERRFVENVCYVNEIILTP